MKQEESITSRENPAVRQVVRLNRSAKYRRETGLFVAEGIRLCMDAVHSGVPIERFFYTSRAIEKHEKSVVALMEKAKKSSVVSDSIMGTLSDTQAPQGAVCVCRMLDKTDCAVKMDTSTHLLLLENIQDPSNLGTILRTAEALGIEGVFLSDDCCDCYSPKVLRGSMGAVFRIPIYIVNALEDAVCSLHERNYQVFAAVPTADAQRVTNRSFTGKTAMVIGNEGNGLTSKVILACTERLTIPMLGRAESLNAATAAAILMWEMVRDASR